MQKVPKISMLLIFTFCAPLLASAPGLPEVDAVYPTVPDWRNAKILHIGDSHVSRGFTAGLARHLRSVGAQYEPKGWIGSRTKSWVVSGKARRLMESFHPNVVIVTLGTNEMGCRTPASHISWIRALVNKIGNRTCYWVGPPPLLEDAHGYNELVRKEVSPCRFFDSRVLEVKRKPEGVFHLSRNEGEVWAELIWKWMNGR